MVLQGYKQKPRVASAGLAVFVDETRFGERDSHMVRVGRTQSRGSGIVPASLQLMLTDI